ncbi:MAG: peptide-methionine (S)-S-oxide reductase MsrA [Verrucomicrobia bacterium]|nr:peptide-methionine (S)-S-oxide reductase MsrA [Verrucomicrobiota bacterium]
MAPSDPATSVNPATATLGGGCFWCLEALFKMLPGVLAVQSGYAGGHVSHPNYRQVCSGTTGHAEVVQIQFDPHIISYGELLDYFWLTHDPTTLNRQGNDVGTHYRSIILCHDEQQEQVARQAIKAAEASGVFDRPIVTQIDRLQAFYPAEDYHNDYFANHPQQAYCAYVIQPKVDKIRKIRKL